MDKNDIVSSLVKLCKIDATCQQFKSYFSNRDINVDNSICDKFIRLNITYKLIVDIYHNDIDQFITITKYLIQDNKIPDFSNQSAEHIPIFSEFYTLCKYIVDYIRRLKCPLLEIKTTMCFGTCPVYSAIIHKDGKVSYTGDMYVNKIGKHTFSLSSKQLKLLYDKIQSIDIKSLDTVYDSNITDLPSNILTFYDDNCLPQTTIVRHNIPNNLRDLIDTISNIMKQYYK